MAPGIEAIWALRSGEKAGDGKKVLTLPSNALPKEPQLAQLLEARLRRLLVDAAADCSRPCVRQPLPPLEASQATRRSLPCRGLVLSGFGYTQERIHAVLEPVCEVRDEAEEAARLLERHSRQSSPDGTASRHSRASSPLSRQSRASSAGSRATRPMSRPQSSRAGTFKCSWKGIDRRPVQLAGQSSAGESEEDEEEESQDEILRCEHEDSSRPSSAEAFYDRYSRCTSPRNVPQAQGWTQVTRPPKLPPWSRRFYKPSMLPRVGASPQPAPISLAGSPRLPVKQRSNALHFYGAGRGQRRPEQALEVNADGSFDFPGMRPKVPETEPTPQEHLALKDEEDETPQSIHQQSVEVVPVLSEGMQSGRHRNRMRCNSVCQEEPPSAAGSKRESVAASEQESGLDSEHLQDSAVDPVPAGLQDSAAAIDCDPEPTSLQDSTGDSDRVPGLQGEAATGFPKRVLSEDDRPDLALPDQVFQVKSTSSGTTEFQFQLCVPSGPPSSSQSGRHTSTPRAEVSRSKDRVKSPHFSLPKEKAPAR
ncbi:unnamed protein product [Effrenium voratum]|nr:unnamed protein product [Effrenium voratum]